MTRVGILLTTAAALSLGARAFAQTPTGSPPTYTTVAGGQSEQFNTWYDQHHQPGQQRVGQQPRQQSQSRYRGPQSGQYPFSERFMSEQGSQRSRPNQFDQGRSDQGQFDQGQFDQEQAGRDPQDQAQSGSWQTGQDQSGQPQFRQRQAGQWQRSPEQFAQDQSGQDQTGQWQSGRPQPQQFADEEAWQTGRQQRPAGYRSSPYGGTGQPGEFGQPPARQPLVGSQFGPPGQFQPQVGGQPAGQPPYQAAYGFGPGQGPEQGQLPGSQRWQVVGKILDADATVPGLDRQNQVVHIRTRDGQELVVDLGNRRGLQNLDLKQGQSLSIQGRPGSVRGQPVLFADEVGKVSQTTSIQRGGTQPGQRGQSRQTQQQHYFD